MGLPMSKKNVQSAAMSDAQRASLAEQLFLAKQSKVHPTIPKRSHNAKFLPLSFAQQRSWFLDQLEPGNPAYNVPIAFRLRGNLDRSAVQKSLDELVIRHESLRTIFPAIQGEPQQVVTPVVSAEIQMLNLDNVPEGSRDAECRRLTQELIRIPFNLALGPVFRATLLRLHQTDHILVLTLHHIVADAWSVGVLLREFTQLYRGIVTGQPVLLSALPIQYSDYA